MKTAPVAIAACVVFAISAAIALQDREPVSAAPKDIIISLDDALRVVHAAQAKADEIGTPMNIAVVGIGGHLKAFVRMDGALLGSVDIAIRKARTSRFFDAPTGALGSLSQPGGPLFGIEESNDGLITFAGGVPLTNDEGIVVGAVGVSGSTVENDLAVAEAGAAAF